MPGHGGECRTPAALTDRRKRLTERRREETLVTPEARFRWNRAYKLKLMGLTPERFAQMLEAQGCLRHVPHAVRERPAHLH